MVQNFKEVTLFACWCINWLLRGSCDIYLFVLELLDSVHNSLASVVPVCLMLAFLWDDFFRLAVVFQCLLYFRPRNWALCLHQKCGHLHFMDGWTATRMHLFPSSLCISMKCCADKAHCLKSRLWPQKHHSTSMQSRVHFCCDMMLYFKAISTRILSLIII